MNFSATIPDEFLKILVDIPLSTEHLFYNNFVHLSFDNCLATYGRIRPCLISENLSVSENL